MVNLSKRRLSHWQTKWQKSGATGTIEDAIKKAEKSKKLVDKIDTIIDKNGFNQVYNFNNNDTYKGNADVVILVWNLYQVIPAEQYRKSWLSDKKTDIVICEDPNVQQKQIDKERSIIYHFA